ncbi:LysR substrate-binding domain-containing protein [Mycoplasma sp. P36-A1]|uniref:LysR substrate-binding domain-containing protein n=1 Tax=Mycoplasma sp. P36-A1 TaxID=3252900 RepID=UPI003C302989
MNIRQIEVFLSVSNTLSISKSAKELFISQPAVSKTIKELEDNLDILLFDRIDNRLSLNEYGKVFKIKAIQLKNDFYSLENFTNNYANEIPLRIGTSLTIAMNSLVEASNMFKQQYPSTPLKIYCENVEQIQRKLLNGEIDIAFTEGFISNNCFEKFEISRYNLFLVCNAKSIYSKIKKVNQTNILELPFLLREKGSSLRDCFDELTHKFDLEVVPFIESINTEVLINVVSNNLGITILPEPIASKYLKSNKFIALDLLDSKLSTINYAVTLKGKSLNKMYLDIIECFKLIENKL